MPPLSSSDNPNSHRGRDSPGGYYCHPSSDEPGSQDGEGVPPTSPSANWAWDYIHEVNQGNWAFGGKLAAAEDKPRYRVALTVPEGVLDEAHKKGLIEEVTQVVVESKGIEVEKPGPPLVTCFIQHVAEGGYGVAAQVYHRPSIT